MSDTSQLDQGEKLDMLFKASLGFPTTKEDTDWYQEVHTFPFSGYTPTNDVLIDTIPHTPVWGDKVYPNSFSEVGYTELQSGSFYSNGGYNGYYQDDITGTIRKYKWVKLEPVSTSMKNGYYNAWILPSNNGTGNLLRDGIQFNVGDSSKPYIYDATSTNYLNIMVSQGASSESYAKLGFGPDFGNWLYDIKSGVLYFPDYGNAPDLRAQVNTTSDPYMTFYRYIGRKGLNKLIDVQSDSMESSSPGQNNQIHITMNSNEDQATMQIYDGVSETWKDLGGSGGSGGGRSEYDKNIILSDHIRIDDIPLSIYPNSIVSGEHTTYLLNSIDNKTFYSREAAVHMFKPPSLTVTLPTNMTQSQWESFFNETTTYGIHATDISNGGANMPMPYTNASDQNFKSDTCILKYDDLLKYGISIEVDQTSRWYASSGNLHSHLDVKVYNKNNELVAASTSEPDTIFRISEGVSGLFDQTVLELFVDVRLFWDSVPTGVSDNRLFTNATNTRTYFIFEAGDYFIFGDEANTESFLIDGIGRDYYFDNFWNVGAPLYNYSLYHGHYGTDEISHDLYTYDTINGLIKFHSTPVITNRLTFKFWKYTGRKGLNQLISYMSEAALVHNSGRNNQINVSMNVTDDNASIQIYDEVAGQWIDVSGSINHKFDSGHKRLYLHDSVISNRVADQLDFIIGTDTFTPPTMTLKSDMIEMHKPISAGEVTLTTANLSGTLSVTGATYLKNVLSVTGATNLNNTLSVTGATTLGNTLSVNNATYLKNVLSVTGATNLNNTLSVTGATNLKNTLSVNGATYLKNVLSVAGNCHIGQGNLIMSPGSGYVLQIRDWQMNAHGGNWLNFNYGSYPVYTNAHVRFNNGVIHCHIVVANGVVLSSDSRIKTNVQTLNATEALNMFNRIDVKMYTRTDTNTKRIGFIAQDVKNALISSTTQEVKDSVDTFVNIRPTHKPMEYDPEDPDKEPEVDIPDFHSLDYSRLVTILWGALKHQTAAMAALEARVQQLENK